MMKKRILILLSVVIISGKNMRACQSPSSELRKTASKDALDSPTGTRQRKQPPSLSSSTDRLEKATIRDYGNPNGSARFQNGDDLTFHNVFYGV